MSRKAVFTIALVALFLAFIVATLMHNVEPGEGSGFDGVNRPTLERSYAPSFGNFLDAADFGVGVGLPAPDGAATLILLGTALAGLVAARRRV